MNKNEKFYLLFTILQTYLKEICERKLNQKERVRGKMQWTEKKSINILVILGSHWMEEKKYHCWGLKKKGKKIKMKDVRKIKVRYFKIQLKKLVLLIFNFC